MMKRRAVLFFSFFFLAAATVWCALQAMSVEVKNAQVRSSPSFLGSPVGPVAYGERVEVLQQQGDWFEVNAPGGKKGWLHQSALTKKQISFGSGGRDAKTGASGEEIALAGKGFNADVEAKYRASHRNIDFQWVDRMEQMKVSNPEMLSFLNEGAISPMKGGAR